MPPLRWEEKLNKLTDSQIVQGAFLNRLEQAVAQHDTVQIMHDNRQIVQDNTRVMQDAMHRLFERMDRFIRGLEGNGHRPA